MSRELIQLIAAFTGSLSFAIVFHLRGKWLLPAGLGGFACWGIYLLGLFLWDDYFLAAFLASAFSAVYAESIARIGHAPATLFLIPALLPLIPGASLYYAMSSAVRGASGDAGAYLTETLRITLAIAIGMSLVWAFWYMWTEIIRRR